MFFCIPYLSRIGFGWSGIEEILYFVEHHSDCMPVYKKTFKSIWILLLGLENYCYFLMHFTSASGVDDCEFSLE